MTAAPLPYVADPNLERKRGQIRQRFGYDAAKINWDRSNLGQQQAGQTASLTQQFGRMRAQLPGQFAARGLLNSGIYARKLFDFNQDRTNQFKQMQQQQAAQTHGNTYQMQQAGLAQQEGLLDVDMQEAQARAALAAQLRAVV